MDEKLLLKIALICSLTGIVILFFISLNIEKEEKKISEINYEDFGKTIKVKGMVEDIVNYDKSAILKVSQPTTIDVFLYKDRNFSIEKGRYVTIDGEVKETEYGIQIVAHKIDLG